MNKTIESIQGLLNTLENETKSADALIIIDRMRLNLALLKQNHTKKKFQESK